METFLHRFGTFIKGCITGFDRIVFKGRIKSLSYPDGAQAFLARRGVLNKEFKAWMLSHSESITAAAEQVAHTIGQSGVTYFPSSQTDKEAWARAQQQTRDVQQGLLTVLACVEAGQSYRAVFDAQRGFPQLRRDDIRCKHLYFYYDHAHYGFMSVRLQTWFPYEIQIALNGREWLRRSLEAAGCAFLCDKNKFFDLADYPLAQQCLDRQRQTSWEPLLSSFVPEVFPRQAELLGEPLPYTWTLWQSEWATDYLFATPEHVSALTERVLQHAMLTGTGERILRYFGSPVRQDGQPYARSHPEIFTRLQLWRDGGRIRHWVGDNSVKLYNEQNVLRVEMTMNDPYAFTIARPADGHSAGRAAPRQRLLKGVTAIPQRAQVSAAINQRFTAHMATLADTTPLREIFQEPLAPPSPQGHRVRALDFLGKDLAFFQAMADPKFAVSELTNKQLQAMLANQPWAKQKTGKALSARISRHLRLMREHGYLEQLPRQRKYRLTEKGQRITTALTAILAASTQELLEKAA